MRKLKMAAGFLLTAALLLTVSCGAAPATEGGDMAAPVPSPPSEISVGAGRPTVPTTPPAPVVIQEGGYEPSVVVTKGSDADQSWGTERMIVRTGNMWLVVDDIPVVLDRIATLAEEFDGYVVSSRRWEEEERLAGTISIRVAAEYFDDVTRVLRGLAVEVTSEDTYSRDVTEEYIDLSAKLGNLEATEEQYLKLMEKAETVEDILNVQRELSKTRGEIEQTKGRMQYLEQTSATSLIEIYLEQARLNVEFTADKRRVNEGQKIQFSIRQIAGGFTPYSYEWDFGDEGTSTDMTPTNTYKTTGSYTVSLKVTDDRGNTDTETRDGYIIINPGWRAGIVASSAWNGLVTFGHVLTNILIWLGVFSPVWIIIGGIVYWWHRRRKAAPKVQ
ncbi:DUF4349 domain-containing protein [Chloroflexota bacterium]